MSEFKFEKSETRKGDLMKFNEAHIYFGVGRESKDGEKFVLQKHGNGRYTRNITTQLSDAKSTLDKIGVKGPFTFVEEIVIGGNKATYTLRSTSGLEAYADFSENIVLTQEKSGYVSYKLSITGSIKVMEPAASIAKSAYVVGRLDKLRQEIDATVPRTNWFGVEAPP